MRSTIKQKRVLTSVQMDESQIQKLRQHSYLSRKSQREIMSEALNEWFQRHPCEQQYAAHVNQRYATLIKVEEGRPPTVLEVQERNGLTPQQMADKLALKYKTPVSLVMEKDEEFPR